jgi:hypothetical protein
MNTHSSLNTSGNLEIPAGTGNIFTPKEEYQQRLHNLSVIKSNKTMLENMDGFVRLVVSKQNNGGFSWNDLLHFKFLEIQVEFKSRENRGLGDFKVNKNIPPSTWLVHQVDDKYICVVRKAPNGDKQQIAIELYPIQEDNDYYLGVCVGKLRINEDNKLEIGPCGPYPQHCVSNKLDGDAAMALFHFTAKWD